MDPLIRKLQALVYYLDATGYDTDYDFARNVEAAIERLK